MKITVFGGDERLRFAKAELETLGYTVDSIGLYRNEAGDCTTSQVFLLPVPTTRDRQTVFAPLTGEKISLDDIVRAAGKEKLVLCGNYSLTCDRQIDYCKSDAFALKNAVPTAEGAIRIAIERTPYTLWQSRALVIGYGRVGKVLAERLSALKANVTVACRKPCDKAMAEILGYSTADSTRLPDLGRFDLIFNTVDVPLLEDRAEELKQACVIDLSTKGGIAPETAKRFSVDYCKAPGLPGKIAPQTAGKILAQTVHEILKSQ